MAPTEKNPCNSHSSRAKPYLLPGLIAALAIAACSAPSFKSGQGKIRKDSQPEGNRTEVASVETGDRATTGDLPGSPTAGTPIATHAADAQEQACPQSPEEQLKEGTRVRYKEAVAPEGKPCEQEVQSRICVNGKYSPWTGSFSETSCKETMVVTNNETVKETVVQVQPPAPSAQNCQVGMQNWANVTAPSIAEGGAGTHRCEGTATVTTILSGSQITIPSQKQYTRGSGVYSCNDGTLTKVSGTCEFVSNCWFQICYTLIDNSAQGYRVDCPVNQTSGKTLTECKAYCDQLKDLALSFPKKATFPDSFDLYQCYYSGSKQPGGYPFQRTTN